MSNYIIIQESRQNKGQYIALVDRTKKDSGFWTSILKDAHQFADKQSANNRAITLKFNNVRVVPLEEGATLIKPIITYYSVKHSKKVNKNIFQMSNWEYKAWLGYSDVIEQGGGTFT